MKIEFILAFALFSIIKAYSDEDSRLINYIGEFQASKGLRLNNHFNHVNAEDVKECLEECIKVPGCIAVSLHDDTYDIKYGQGCFMFKEGSYYGEAAANWTSYLRNGPFQGRQTKIYDGVRLNSFKSYSVLENKSVHDCWLACERNKMQQSNCVAVSFDKETRKCHQFAHDQYQSEEENAEKWISIAYEEEKVLDYTMFRESGVRLHNPFATCYINETECWKKCKELPNCHGISFSLDEKKYYLINTDDPFATQEQGWKSYMLDEWSQSFAQSFPSTRLLNHFGQVENKQSPESCWIDCQKTDGCVAITFSTIQESDKGSCYKFKASTYSAIEDKSSLTIALKSESPQLTDESLMYENKGVLLFNFYDHQRNQTWQQCLQNCAKTPRCSAVSLVHRNLCLFSEEGKYFGVNDNNVISYTKKKPFEFEFAKTYYDLDLHNSYMTIDNHPRLRYRDCWVECQKRREEGCVAIKHKDKSCFLYKKDEYRSEKRDMLEYTVVAVESENIYELNRFKTPNVELISSLNEFKELKAKTIELCWKLCSRNDECQAIKFHRNQLDRKFSRKCYLFKEGKYYGISSPDWISYHKKEFNSPLAKYYNDTRLYHHFHFQDGSSTEECWLSCLNSKDKCDAISIHEQRCHHFKKDEFSSRPGPGWLSIVRQEILIEKDIIKEPKMVLHNSYTRFQANDVKECWESCQQDELCEAINFKDNQLSVHTNICNLYKKGEYYASKGTGWLTYFKSTYTGHLVSFYDGVRLTDEPLNISKVDSKEKCWLKCADESACDVISFNAKLKECHSFERHGFRQIKEDGWETIAPQEVEVLEQTMFKRKVKLLHSYREVETFQNIESCWSACQEDLKCEAMSFLDEPRSCKLIGKGSLSYERIAKWVSYFKKLPSTIPKKI